jgi:hypothetical protein
MLLAVPNITRGGSDGNDNLKHCEVLFGGDISD